MIYKIVEHVAVRSEIAECDGCKSRVTARVLGARREVGQDEGPISNTGLAYPAGWQFIYDGAERHIICPNCYAFVTVSRRNT